MLDKKTLKIIEKKAKTYFPPGGSHGWDHVLRVYNLAAHIGEKERADLDVIRVATLLHDIARNDQDKAKGDFCHAEVGAEMSKVILSELGFETEFINRVSHAIAAHRFRKDVSPQSLEAEVLRDADKLDGIGAVGIGRAFMFAGEIGSKLHNPEISQKPLLDRAYSSDDTAYQEYLFKLSKIKDLMHTKEGKRIAGIRDGFMKDFFDTLNKEFDGVE